MIHIRLTFMVAAALFAAAASAPRLSEGQNFVEWDAGGDGDWADAFNWFDGDGGGAPPMTSSDGIGLIFDNSTVFVDSVVPTAAGIIIGEAPSESGHLEIRSGGVLNVDKIFFAGFDRSRTSVNVGGPNAEANTLNGTGTLKVEPGGTLNAFGLFSASGPTNLITLGGAAAGTTTVTANVVALNGTTRVIGPNVSLNVSDSLSLLYEDAFLGRVNHNLILEYGAGNSISKLSAAGNGVLGGTLDAEFDSTPSVGDRWTIVDAANVFGQFSSVGTSNTTLGPGQALGVRTSAGGSNGTIAELVVEQRLVLNVNRNTGIASIENLGGTAVAFDGYHIGSTDGNLIEANWSNLQGNPSTPDWLASPASSDNGLAELRMAGTQSLTSANGQISLGDIFDVSGTPFSPLVANREDLSFTFASSTGVSMEGLVEYEGNSPVTLTLAVDPSTGAAELRNGTSLSVDIDGYSISSPSGSISTNGSSGLGVGWDSSAGNDNSLFSQLNQTSATTLMPGSAMSVGQLFSTAGTAAEDFEMAFILQAGAVLDADFDADGDSDGNDFLQWQRGFGSTFDANNLADWESEFGSSGSGGLPPGSIGATVIYESLAPLGGVTASGVTTIPEPASLPLIAVGAVAIVLRYRQGK